MSEHFEIKCKSCGSTNTEISLESSGGCESCMFSYAIIKCHNCEKKEDYAY